MSRIDEVVSYNEQYQLPFEISERKIPNVNCVFTKKVQTETEFLPTCTIDRLYSIYNDGELSKVSHMLNNGYDCLHVDNSLILIQ